MINIETIVVIFKTIINKRDFYNMKYIKKFDTNTNYNKFVMSSDYIEPHTSMTDTQGGGGISSINYNIPNNVILFSYKVEAGKKPIDEEKVKSCGTVKDIIYDDENGIGKIIFEHDVTTIGDKAFYKCLGLTSIIIPNSVTSIGEYAFFYCPKLKFIIIPNSVTSIKDNAFKDCITLTSITIPDSVTTIGYSAFSGCKSLKSITIPNSITYINRETFDNCLSLISITIPDSVTTIKEYALNNCSSLTSINIPSSVTTIGYGVFYDCTSLAFINYTGTLDQFKLISDKVLQDIKTNAGLTITCTNGKYNANLEPIS